MHGKSLFESGVDISVVGKEDVNQDLHNLQATLPVELNKRKWRKYQGQLKGNHQDRY